VKSKSAEEVKLLEGRYETLFICCTLKLFVWCGLYTVSWLPGGEACKMMAEIRAFRWWTLNALQWCSGCGSSIRLFFCKGVSVICPTEVLKHPVTVCTGMFFQTLWPNWLTLFGRK